MMAIFLYDDDQTNSSTSIINEEWLMDIWWMFYGLVIEAMEQIVCEMTSDSEWYEDYEVSEEAEEFKQTITEEVSCLCNFL